MQATGAKILIESLIEQGVDIIFGYPGGSVLDFYDELFKSKDRIRHILSAHEQGATHAADGYARSTGKTGVVIATSGPGATNLVTGLATAYLDSTPMVAVTANVPTALLGKDSFQEVDITGLTVPITKHNFLIKKAEDIPATIRKAFEIANSGRPGPVLVDIPKDVGKELVEYAPKGKFTKIINTDFKEEKILTAAEIINAAKRPMIYFGGGIKSSGAKEALRAFSAKIDSPMASSSMGLSTFAYDMPRFLGLLGMHGRPVCNKAIDECDVLIAVGARFSDRILGDKDKFAANSKVIHIDVDNSELGKNLDVELKIWGDAKTILEQLTAKINEKNCESWNKYLMDYKAEIDVPVVSHHGHVDPRKVIKAVSKVANYEALVVTDVGQHQMMVAQNYRFTEESAFISSCGLGTMGFGVGAANGAQVGNPDKRVVLFIGDGGFHMNLNELAVAVTEKLPIIIVVLNNSVLGMVRQWQKLFYDERYSATDVTRATDFVKLAEAFGAVGMRIKEDSEIDEVLTKAFNAGGPVVIDCVVSKDYGVFPFIPAGMAFGDTILNDK